MNYRSDFTALHLKTSIIEHHYAICTSGSSFWWPAVEGRLSPAMLSFSFFTALTFLLSFSEPQGRWQSHKASLGSASTHWVLLFPALPCLVVYLSFCINSLYFSVPCSKFSPPPTLQPDVLFQWAWTIKSWLAIQLIHDLLWRLYIACVRA